MAFIQLNSAASTWSALSFSTCSWKILMWSMKATTLSAAMGEAWRPAAASRGAMCSGMLHWAAFSTNSSDHTSRSNATCGWINKNILSQVKIFNPILTWSVSCRSGKPGILLAHSTAEKSSLAANSQMESMVVMLCCSWAYLATGEHVEGELHFQLLHIKS